MGPRRTFLILKAKVKSLSHVLLFVTPWTVAHQDPLSMGFSRQEDWSGLPFPYSEDLPGPGIKPPSPMPSVLLVDSLPTELCNIVTGILTVILNFQRLYSIYSY